VAKGHTPGIYFSKKAVMKEVADFDSPVFAKVLTIEAAKKFISEFNPVKDLENEGDEN
jgi:viroplasmin and RNaseH domain-containing protein